MKAFRFAPLAGLVALLLLGQGAAEAQGPFTPTFSFTLDEVAPDDPDTLPADDDCPVGAPCKTLWRLEIPDGQPGAEISGGAHPPSIGSFVGAAVVPDGAIVGKIIASWKVGPIGSCTTEGWIFSDAALSLDATTDPSTTTGSPSDLCSFSHWPTQLNGVRDGILTTHSGAVLDGRSVACSTVLVENVLGFREADGSLLYVVVGGDPTAPSGWESCGPSMVKSIGLGLSADNPDTPSDEGGIPLLTCTAAGPKTIAVSLDRVDTPPGDPLVLEDTVTCSPNTPAGSGVSVPLNGGTANLGGMNLIFSNVTNGGSTMVITTTAGPPPPTGFKIVGLAELPLYFDINTDASYSGDLTVCVRYDETQVEGPEDNLKLMQRVDDSYVDVTASVDTVGDIVCGGTAHLSIFVVTQPLPAVGGTIELRPDADAPSVQQSDSAILPFASLAAAAATGLVIALGVWRTRRRWLR